MNKRFILKPTVISPCVLLDHSNKTLEIKGRSVFLPDFQFYNTVFKELKIFFENKNGALKVNIFFEYLSTHTTQGLFKLLKKLHSYQTTENVPITINWYYEDGDEDILEKGEAFKELLGLQFNFYSSKFHF